MAVYGIGAYWDGTEDVSEEFIHNGIACIGWDISDAPTLFQVMKFIKNGDIIYIKAAPPGQFIIKAVGIVINNEIQPRENMGSCIQVNWLWSGNEHLNISDKYNVRNNTLYEEFNLEVQTWAIDHIIQNRQ